MYKKMKEEILKEEKDERTKNKQLGMNYSVFFIFFNFYFYFFFFIFFYFLFFFFDGPCR